MAWFVGTTTDYRDLLDKVREYSTAAFNLTAVTAIAAGGSGYVVGDTLTLSGGTSTTAAQVEVSEVSGGAVTGVRILHAGAYSVAPTSPVSTTGGTGTGATLTCTFTAPGWTALRDANQIFPISVQTIPDDGSGYAVNDIVTLDSSGDAGVTAVTEATFRITSVDGSGQVTGIAVETLGEYSAASPTVGIPTTGGTGSGLEIIPIFDGLAGEDQLILRGDGSGSDEIYVGIQTFSNAGTGATNWDLAGMTGFAANTAFANQSGISPGRHDSVVNTGGSFLPARNASMNFWMAINARRIFVVIQTGTNYHSAFLGFIDPLLTSSAYAYPLAVIGTSNDPTIESTSASIGLGGIPDPVSSATAIDSGPGSLRLPNGVWQPIKNANSSGSSLNDDRLDTINIWPSTIIPNPPVDNFENWVSTIPAVNFQRMFVRSVGGTPVNRLEPTPGSGDSFTPLFPLTLVDITNAGLLGQLPELFWLTASQDGASSAISNDTFTLANGDRYRIFQNVSRASVYNFFCVREV